MSLSHDGLAESLAGHLRTEQRMVWCDLQLGPSGSVRPDVFTIDKSFVRPCHTAYECKVSVSDFRADVTSGKWQSYLRYAGGVYFACESGLIGKADVPEHCGLIVLKDGTWRAVKKATRAFVEIPSSAWLKLLIDGVQREGPKYRAKHWTEHSVLASITGRVGAEVASAIKDLRATEVRIEANRHHAQRILDDAHKEAERIRNESVNCVQPLKAELCAALNLKPDAGRWEIEDAVRRLRESQAEHPAQVALKRFTRAIESALEQHGHLELPVAEEASCPTGSTTR